MVGKIFDLKKEETGFTLIELLIYTVLMVIISVVAVTFVIQFVNVVETARRSRESLDNARRVMDVVGQEVKHANSVYTPTTVTNQLSLETTRDLPTDEENTYVDFYVDDQRLYMRREGQNPQIVISEKVRLSSLTFTILQDSNQRQFVRTQVTVEYADPISGPSNAVSLVSTTALRSY
jgi:type II secretory pathway pseudopilin PulG